MFCKIFKHGRGKATGIDYLISSKDASGQLRVPPAELTRGDIDLTKRLIRDLYYAQKYTSGVLSWAESPTEVNDSILKEVMDSFQEMLGAGLEQDRLNWFWAKHQDKGRIELHWIVPNVDLESGKRFAPYFDRTDRPRFRAWERFINTKYCFANPADPKRKRDLRIPSNLPKIKVDAIDAIHSVISSLVAKKIIRNRDEIIQRLQEAGYQISRQGKDYISIQDAAGQKLRLRGALYEANFTSIESLKSPSSNNKENAERNIQGLQIELEVQLNKRRGYIESRYPPITVNANDHISVSQNTSMLNFNDGSSNKLEAIKGEVMNGSARKLSDRSDEEYGSRAQSTLRRIDSAIIESGRSAQLFCRSVQCAIDRIGRTIDQLRKTAANIYTY